MIDRAADGEMRAMCLRHRGECLLVEERRPLPVPGPGQVRLRVEACGVCRTDLHLVDGELPMAKYPVIPGHEIVGLVDAVGSGVTRWKAGERVGVPWLGRTCGCCGPCASQRENLCDRAEFTGCSRDGGFATHAVADADWCLPLPPERFPDAVATAPLLCAGLIGWRALAMAGAARRIGIYGFGAAAHVIAQVARWQGREIYAFTRPGDDATQAFARELGASWAGGSDESSPEMLDAALIFAPDGRLVPKALSELCKGGVVVCGGIHMSDIPGFPYRLLWGERQIRSVANLTRGDGAAFLEIAQAAGVTTHTRVYALGDANAALDDLRGGRLKGAAVLTPGGAPTQ